ncbi:MAG: hypothetical protein LKE52_04045 [Bacilli bacterium]|jgi:TM2 domain-containing membrane protein YozV|nr:hypothetical protein [Bacilli bacterium]
MSNEEYSVPEKKVDPWLLVIIFFLGWLGIDKIYYVKSFKKGGKFFFVKLAFIFIGLGVIWNIIDFIKACMGKYEEDFRDYFK